MAVLTIIEATHGTPSAAAHAAAAAGGDYAIVTHPERTFVSAKNTHTGAQGVTIKGKQSSNQGQLNDNTVSVPLTSGYKLIPIRHWEVDDAGRVDLEYPDGVTDLTIAVIQIGA